MIGEPVGRAVREFARRRLDERSTVVVACSGGADSLALAAACVQVLGPARLIGVTIDHGLQHGSAAQAARTAGQLTGLGYRRAEVRTVIVGRSGGLEAAARTARYQALQPEPGQLVLLGHTLDDQAETVLLGLGRGSGPRSIAGMREWRPPWGRPLLGVRRADTEAYCAQYGLQPWQDPHNMDPAFTRVRLRHEVLPLLEEVLGGGVAPALARTADQLADDLAALDQLAGQARTEVQHGDRLDVRALRGHPAAVRRRVLRGWAGSVGAGNLTAGHLQRLDQLVTAVDAEGAAVRLPGAVDAVRRAGWLAADPLTPGRGGEPGRDGLG